MWPSRAHGGLEKTAEGGLLPAGRPPDAQRVSENHDMEAPIADELLGERLPSKIGLRLQSGFHSDELSAEQCDTGHTTRSRTIRFCLPGLSIRAAKKKGVECLSFSSVGHLKTGKRALPGSKEIGVLRHWPRNRVQLAAATERLRGGMRKVGRDDTSPIPQKAPATLGLAIARPA